MSDDTIRLDLELDSSQAQKQAQRFITDLERRFQRLSKQLNNALKDGVVDSADTREVKQLRQELDRLEKELKQLKTAGDGAKKGLSGIGVALSALGGVIAGLGLANLAQGFIQLGQDAIQATASLEQTRLALESLVARELVRTGQFDNLNDALAVSGQRAEELLQILFELARTSPFSREQIVDAFRLAQAYGFSSEEALRLTQNTVDLAAATGASAEAISRIALAFGQIRARGVVSAEELRQLQEAGFAANDVLDDLGVTLDDVSNRLVSADVFLEAASRRIEEDFGGAAARATNSLTGLISTLGDLRTDALVAFFEPALQTLQPQLQEFTEGFQDSVPSIREAGQAFGELLTVIIEKAPQAKELTEGLAVAFGGLAEIVGTLQSIQEFEFLGLSLEDLQPSLNPIGDILTSIQQLRSEPSVGGFFDGVLDTLSDIPLFQTAIDDIQFRFERLSFTTDILNNAQRLLADGFNGTTQELIELAIAQAAQQREEERLAQLQADSIARQGELQDRIQQTAIIRQRSAQVATQAAEAEAEATKEQAQAQRDLVIELVKSVDATDKSSQAIFDQAEAAGASAEQLTDLAISLGLLTPEQIAAKQEADALTLAFVDGDVEAGIYRATMEDLNAVIAGTGTVASRTANNISSLNNAFRDAISPSNRRRSSGGGNTRRNSLLAEAEAIEQQAEAIERSTQNFADLVLEIAEVDQALAEAREELNKAINEGASEEDLQALRENIDNIQNSTESWEDSLFRLTQEAGASIETISQLGVATGLFTQEQADAAVAAINRERGLRAIAKALAEQSLSTEDATAAAEELNRQLAEGEDIDLTAFGVDVSQVDTEAIPALLRETALASREAAEALKGIAGALGGVDEASESLGQTLKRQIAQQRFENAENVQARIDAINLSLALGLVDEEAANLLATEVLLTEQTDLLGIALENNAITDDQFAEALRLVTDEGFSARDAILEVGGSLEDLPEEVLVRLDTNKDEVLAQIGQIDQALNELERERVVRLRVEREDITVSTGGTGAGSVPTPEDADFSGQSGGYTGQGRDDEVAGIVHRNELVVPRRVLAGGVPAIASFASQNVPNFRNTMMLTNSTPVASAVVPTSTVINNSTSSGDTINTSNTQRGGDTIIFNGVESDRIARSIFNQSNYNRQSNIMKRNSQVNALF